jgi:DNA-directed RNA polymerase specialized sigma24 family protein
MEKAEAVEATDTRRVPARAPLPARTGDTFRRAISEHHRPLARFAYALCGDVTPAEDVVAAAYARTWPRWRRGQVGDLFGHLRRLVAQEVYGTPRAGRRAERWNGRRTAPGPDGQFEAGGGGGDGDALWDGLARLSPQLRVVVVLRVVEDLSEAQTAAMLDLAPSAVRSHLSRALTLLRGCEDDVA